MAEALRAVKEMVGDGVSPGANLREAVYRGMLREARIDEARELDAALKCIEEEGNGFGGAVEVLDRLLREWEE
ncbi:putative pentatricopeptide repeat-containing protein, mitochondrial-like [Cocos nucifera]|uniref:Putative pentatricopeptide repeat-containing protein, mitochondrial-like n=1 Tax=Cocos nucifera TaxID=13894 RepID=A0A8K0NAA9_COCNU|nr:putative pentatricopeptide repeat-containing protein, mitochondrial-like [Cocos nucifera]